MIEGSLRRPYQHLLDCIDQNEPIIITENKIGTSVTIGPLAGEGGFKLMYDYDANTVLAMPNYKYLTPRNKGQKWDYVVSDEINGCKFLNTLSILNVDNSTVYISCESNTRKYETYISRSFDSFARDGVYVLEDKKLQKHKYTSNLLKHLRQWKDDVFSRADIRDEQLWKTILTPLMDDLSSMLANGFIVSADNLNFALIRSTEYYLRYFGFDFSGLYGFVINPRNNRPDIRTNGREKFTNYIVHAAADLVYCCTSGTLEDAGIRELVLNVIGSYLG